MRRELKILHPHDCLEIGYKGYNYNVIFNVLRDRYQYEVYKGSIYNCNKRVDASATVYKDPNTAHEHARIHISMLIEGAVHETA